MERKKEKVLGCNVDLLNFENAINLIKDNLKQKSLMHIVTINPEIIELAKKNKEYYNIIKNADLTVPDGIGIKIALKLRGINQEQIPGIDLSKEIIKICAENNIKIALIGAKEEIIQKAKNNLLNEYKNLKISYIHNGYFKEDEETDIINELKYSQAKFIMIALGVPKQDFFIKKCKESIEDGIFIGVGGSFDVWAGEVKRAPVIYRKMGCEWLYRTIKQPERIKRIYKTLPLFLFKAIIEAIYSQKEIYNKKQE